MINQDVGMMGIFRIFINGEETPSRVCPNVITNVGLAQLAQNDFNLPQRISLGKGTSTPSFEDTSMTEAFDSVSLSFSGSSFSTGVNTVGDTYTFGRIRTSGWQLGFPINGDTYTEVGIFGPYGILWSRALIRDANGNLAPLTVGMTDTVVVEYELRMYPKITDTTGSMTIKGTPTTYTLRPANFARFNFNQIDLETFIPFSIFASGFNQLGKAAFVYDTDNNQGNVPVNLVPITDNFDGINGTGTLGELQTSCVFENGVLTKTFKYAGSTPFETANFRTMIYNAGSADFFGQYPARPIQFQVQFDPPIPTSQNEEIIFTFSFSVSRR